MINVAEELFINLSGVADTYFNMLEGDEDTTKTLIIFELYESGSYSTLSNANFAGDVDLTVKILNPDAAVLFEVAEQVKSRLLSQQFAHIRDISFRNSVPILQDDELNTSQYTLNFLAYVDTSVTLLEFAKVVERGVTTDLRLGDVYEVSHEPVTVINPNTQETLILADGATYTVPEFIKPAVTERGVTTELSEGEVYEVVHQPAVVINPNNSQTINLNDGETYTVPAFVKPSVVERGVTTELSEGQVYEVSHESVTVVNPNTSETLILSDGATYTVPAFVKPVVTDRGMMTSLSEGQNYNVIHEPVTVTDKGVTHLLQDGETYNVIHAPVTVINPNTNTTTSLHDGETYSVPVIVDEVSIVATLPDVSGEFMSIRITTEEANYITQELSNVRSIIYKKNNQVVTFPFSLANGDYLDITIEREAINTDSVVKIKSF